ncbi:MAG TPA: LPS export ABC transporter periplasmic protein LptC [Desulfatiglandales bacterium]|nr:LPS export ABC transporter periplasmic protein LptC [Desulfatiglandales bacterium]
MKKVPLIILPIVGIVFLLSMSLFFLISMPRLDTDSKEDIPLVSGESLKVSDIEYGQDYRDGKGKWELKAKEARLFNKGERVALTDVFVKLHPSENISYTIKGNECDYLRDIGELILKGDVIGNSNNGYRIETNMLTYKTENESVETEEPVTIIGPFFWVKGNGLYVDFKEKKFMIKKNVCASFSAGDFL